MDSVNITALRRIEDGPYLLAKGKGQAVAKPYADEWIARGWASLTPVRAKVKDAE